MTRALLLCLAALTLGCRSATGPEGERTISYLKFDASGDPLIQLPDRVAVGEGFTVTVGTVWGDHCAKKGDTAVETEDLAARITPHEVSLEGVCAQALKTFTHEATLRFGREGTARVVVRGRNLEGDVVTFERTVAVQ